MSPISIAPAIMDTVLGHLAILFLIGAGGDPTRARQAAAQMLGAYAPQTPDELSLAAEIVSFGFHALEALSQAAVPDMALAKILRLRGSAVSLSREGHKAQRKLDQLQRARAAAQAAETPAPAIEPAHNQPQIQEAIGMLEVARSAMGSAVKHGGNNWTKGFQQREVAKRIAANLKKNQAAHAASLNAAKAATAES